MSRSGLFSLAWSKSLFLTADLLEVVSDKIVRAFSRSGAARAVTLDISKAFDRVWHACLLHKLNCYGSSSQIYGLILSFLSKDGFRWFWMGSLHKNIQLLLEFIKAPFFVQHFSYYALMNYLMMLSALVLPVLMILLTTLSAIRHLIYGNN